MRSFRLVLHVATALPAVVFAVGCAAQSARTPNPARASADTSDAAVAAAMHAEMNGMSGMSHEGGHDMASDPHMLMTALRTPSPGDSARAAALVADIRRDLAK